MAEKLTPLAYLAFLVMAILAWPITLPFLVILGYPALIVAIVVFTGKALIRLARGVWNRDLASLLGAIQAVALAVVCGALCFLILRGILMNVDTALAGAPPTLEEKAFGQRLAYSGAIIATVAAIVAYACDPAWVRPRDVAPRKQPLDPLD